jgi:hypothetical protein
MTITHIHVRDARDRLIDLLGIGQTYPLRDLAVRDEQLTVAFNTSAKVPIEPSQRGVVYQLHNSNNKPVAGAEAQGNGDQVIIETPKIQEDITYTIYAKKLLTGRDTYLRETATVKVGLDITLQAWIRNAPPLDPASENPALTDPRIVHYGASVEVELKNSQEGVDYRLVSFEDTSPGTDPKETEVSVAAVRGDLRNIVLRSKAMVEDTDIRIRATKVFDPSENRASQTALLDIVLPLKVRANPALPVAVEPSIVNFNQQATITIANTQRSARYQLYIRKIPDRDFVHTTIPATEVVKVSVAGKPEVQVRKPPRSETWNTPGGYRALGELQPGSGGDLRFTVSNLTDDSLVIVQARKEHQATAVVSSTMQLEQTTVALVRPNPAPGLKLQALAAAGTLQASGGQPGVFYYFRIDPNGQDLAAPVYFHKRDDDDQSLNKGIDQLAIEIDFVMTRDWSAEKIGASRIIDPRGEWLRQRRGASCPSSEGANWRVDGPHANRQRGTKRFDLGVCEYLTAVCMSLKRSFLGPLSPCGRGTG